MNKNYVVKAEGMASFGIAAETTAAAKRAAQLRLGNSVFFTVSRDTDGTCTCAICGTATEEGTIMCPTCWNAAQTEWEMHSRGGYCVSFKPAGSEETNSERLEADDTGRCTYRVGFKTIYEGADVKRLLLEACKTNCMPTQRSWEKFFSARRALLAGGDAKFHFA